MRKVRTLAPNISPEELRRVIIAEWTEPVVLKGIISEWESMKWTPEFFSDQVPELETRVKLASCNVDMNDKHTLMETECCYEDVKVSELISWLHGDQSTGKLEKYDRDKFWCYMDYKYMAELFKDLEHMNQAIDWSLLGFPGRTGEQSTLWIGSDQAFTPCHIDSYGCNLVAQIYGHKKWTLFSPTESRKLYPTRIPYEESSIFSKVNISNPDYNLHPLFADAVRYVVELEPGDVLFVPNHWWHHVESLDITISVNTWIELESDNFDRLKEAIVRTMVCSLKSSEGILDDTSWLNPTEEVVSHEQNLNYIQQVLGLLTASTKRTSNCTNEQTLNSSTCGEKSLSTDSLINVITRQEVLEVIAKLLLETNSQSETIKNVKRKNMLDKELTDIKGKKCKS